MKKIGWMALSLLLASCGGTGAGNPGETNVTAGPASGYASTDILQSICILLVSCPGGPSSSTCLSGIQNTSGIASTLGLSSGSYANYAAIESAEESGSIQPNQPATSLCESQIAALSCSSSAVQAAYQAGAGNPFADVPGMMPTSTGSCGSVF